MSRRTFVMAVAVLAMFGPACKGGKKPKPPEAPTDVVTSTFKKLKKRIRKHVKDPARRKPALKLADAAKEDILGMKTATGDWRSAIARLPDNERFDRDRLAEITKAHNGEIMDRLKTAAGRAVEMRQHISADEWPLVFPEPKA